jgi:hypothetical protein
MVCTYPSLMLETSVMQLIRSTLFGNDKEMIMQLLKVLCDFLDEGQLENEKTPIAKTGTFISVRNSNHFSCI